MPHLALFVCDICKTERRLEDVHAELPSGWVQVGITIKGMLPARLWPFVCSRKCARQALEQAVDALDDDIPYPDPETRIPS